MEGQLDPLPPPPLRSGRVKRCGSYMRIKRSLAKLNIKHRMCCNKPVDYKLLTKFFLDIIAWFYGKEVTAVHWGIEYAKVLSLG